MFKKITHALVIGGMVAASPLANAASHSGGGSNWEASANVGFVTDYAFRGISQNDESPAIQGGFDFSHKSGFYVGTWASNIEQVDLDTGNNSTNIEIDGYLGFGGEFKNGLSWDIGYLYYWYPDATQLDYGEVYGSLGYDFGPAALTVGVAYSDDFFGETGDATYYYGDLEIPLPKDFSVTLHVGHQDIDENTNFGTPDYDEYSITLAKSFKGFDFSLAYKDTDLSDNECFGGTEYCDAKFIAGVSRSF